MTNSPLITYNPLSQDNTGKRTHHVDQLSVKKFANKTRKTGCSFGVGCEDNTLIVQRLPDGYMDG